MDTFFLHEHFVLTTGQSPVPTRILSTSRNSFLFLWTKRGSLFYHTSHFYTLAFTNTFVLPHYHERFCLYMFKDRLDRCPVVVDMLVHFWPSAHMARYFLQVTGLRVKQIKHPI